MCQIEKDVIQWFIDGEDVGASSTAMVAALLGMPGARDLPMDPADFNRCLVLLDRIPKLKERLPAVADLSPGWARLVARWSELEQLFLEEAGLDWSKSNDAPRTRALLGEILDGEDW